MRQTSQQMTQQQYLQMLIAQGEHRQQDFKYKVQNAIKLAKSVSAFANSEGGRLLIGVRDDGHISGVRSEEEIYMMHAAAYKYCLPESDISFSTFHVEGRNVVIATIPPAAQKPIFAIDEKNNKHAYIRIKDENIIASPIHLEMWKQEQQLRSMMEYTEKTKHLLALIDEKPNLTLNKIVRLSKINRYTVISTLARLIRYNVLEYKYVGEQFTFTIK